MRTGNTAAIPHERDTEQDDCTTRIFRGLPADIVRTILHQYALHADATVCKAFRQCKLDAQHRGARAMQRHFRRHRLIGEEPCENYTKNIALRYYAVYYPTRFLLRYPEFLANKCRWISDEAKEHVRRMPSLDARTRRHALDFLRRDDIELATIHYAGW